MSIIRLHTFQAEQTFFTRLLWRALPLRLVLMEGNAIVLHYLLL